MFFGEYDREMDIRVQRAEAMQEGISVGRAEGIQRGSHNRNIEIARNLKNMGLSLEQIVQGTGLSLEEVQAL